MSIEAMSLVLHHSKANGAGKLVLIGIANHQSDSGAWPAVSTLAKYAGVSERRVQQLVRELEETGELVTRIQEGGRGQYKTNLYWVNVSCPQDCDGTYNHRTGVKSGDSRGEIWSTSGVKPVSPEPKEEPVREPKPQQNQDLLFDEFWDHYPNKREKLPARIVWNRVTRNTDPNVIVAAAKAFGEDPNLPAERKFIKHPATWLNKACWEDGALPERERTAEEKADYARAMNERRRLLDLEHTAKLRAETRAAEEAARLNPPKRCEHDSIAVMCRICNRNT